MTTLFTNPVSRYGFANAFASSARGAQRHNHSAFDSCLLALAIVLAVLLSATGSAHAQWTQTGSNGILEVTDCLLLTDGTVMCQRGETTNQIIRLTPDSTGSYINGTWSTTNITSLPTTYQPRFFCSAVLPDGRVVFEGGEYNGATGASQETNLGYIFDPTADSGKGSWTEITPPDNGASPWNQIGDSPCIVLPNGTFILGKNGSTQMAALDPVTLTYTDLNPTGTDPNDDYAEEGWTLLPDGTILKVDTLDVPNSEIYDPATNKWSLAGSTGVTLAGNGSLDQCNPTCDAEMGPAVLRGDNGYVIQFGATPNNASYDYTEGLWVSAPSFPIPFVCNGISYENAGVNDGPASILPDGHVLVAANPVNKEQDAVFCSVFFEFDGTNLNPVPGYGDADTKPTFGLRMLALPSGDVMVEDGSANVWFYNNGKAADPGAVPKITSALSGIVPGQTYAISGTLFNGVSQGAFYGDDGEWATNYPLVRIIQGPAVTYARTHNHSSMGVAMPDTVVTTYFDVPSNLILGPGTILEVVANGVPSAPLTLNVVSTGSTLLYAGGSLGAYGNDINLEAYLNSTGTSQPPITGATVAFQLGSQSCSGTTDSTGFASCSIVDNQAPGAYTATASYAGNSTYGASSTSSSFNIIPAIQTITFTTNAPASASTASSFTVAATASSGLPVMYTSSGQCSNVGANYSTTNYTGTCTVIANQAGDADYVAAPTVTESVTVTPAAMSFTYAQFTVPASGLSDPNGVAVDAEGDVFIADVSNNRVLKITPSGAQSTVGSGLSGPDGVAVDGAGDVFIADFGNKRVVEVTPGGVQTTLVAGVPGPTGVAVDAAGDVFIALEGSLEVLETPAGCTSSCNATLVWSGQEGTTILLPLGVTVDKAGNVFIPVTGTSVGVVKQAPPYASGVYSFIGSGLNGPTGVGVDAAGDLFIADTGNNRIVELSNNDTVQTTVASAVTNPNGVAVDAAGDVLVTEGSPNLTVEVQRDAVNFGYVNVCPAGQTSPAPCKENLTLNYIANGALAVVNTNVHTQGAPNLDFTLASNTCTGILASGTTCNATVTFSPLAPGARSGALQFSNVSTVLATTFIHGDGKAPAIAFGPGAQLTLPTGGLSAPSSVTVDALGDVFIADRSNNQVYEIPAGCTSSSCQTTLPVLGLSDPSDVAVDGAGDIYIADTVNNRVVELIPGVSGYNDATVGSGLTLPSAVAVDGAGNVFIATNGGEVVEVLANGGAQVTLVSGLALPSSVAVDGAGNVYIADSGNNRVLVVPAGCITSACQVIVPAVGLNGPESVAVDAAGDVYITDQNNNRVIEVPAGGGPQTTVMSGLNLPEGIAVDGAGDVFIADENNHRVVEVQSSKPPTLSFGVTNLGSTSAPQSVTVQNIGNQQLNAVSPGLVVKGPNFLQVAGSGTPADCTSSFALYAGATCNLSISFEPTTGGALASTATFTDNALNTSPSVSQGIALQGTAVATVSATVGTSPAGLAFTVDGTSYTSPQNFSWVTGSVHTIATTATQTPSTGVQDTFTSWSDGGALSHVVTASASTTSYTAAFSTAYLLTTAASPTSGGTVTPVSGTYYAASTVVTLTAKANSGYAFSSWTGNVANALSATTTVTMSAPQAVSASFVQAGKTVTVVSSSSNPSTFGQSVTLTATISHGAAVPTGTVTFKTGSTVLAVATVGSAGTATYTSSSFTVAKHAIIAVYSGDSNYSGSTSAAFSQVVQKAATATSLASSVNPSVFGQSVTLTATVSAVAPGSGTPTGTVHFYDGATLLGSHALASGVAAFSTTKLTTGTHSITAVYVASADYLTSTSSVLSEVVDKASTKTTIASSKNPSTSGSTVTFTATLAAVAPGAGTPTGTVTFMDGATVLGTGTLASKKATFATASLAEGTHLITAVYSGDSNFNGSTSTALSQKVNP